MRFSFNLIQIPGKTLTWILMNKHQGVFFYLFIFFLLFLPACVPAGAGGVHQGAVGLGHHRLQWQSAVHQSYRGPARLVWSAGRGVQGEWVVQLSSLYSGQSFWPLNVQSTASKGWTHVSAMIRCPKVRMRAGCRSCMTSTWPAGPTPSSASLACPTAPLLSCTLPTLWVLRANTLCGDKLSYEHNSLDPLAKRPKIWRNPVSVWLLASFLALKWWWDREMIRVCLKGQLAGKTWQNLADLAQVSCVLY